MQKDEIVVGAEYGHRKTRQLGQGLDHIRVIGNLGRGRYRAEWIEPSAGTVAAVWSKNILVPWAAKDALLEDEQRTLLLAEHDKGVDRVAVAAALYVFDHHDPCGLWVDEDGCTAAPTAIEKLAERVGIAVPTVHELAYTDRRGEQHHPVEDGIALARALVEAEPEKLLSIVAENEEDWTRDWERNPGRDQLIEEYQPVWALIRSWAGQGATVEFDRTRRRDAVLDEWRQLLVETMWDLRHPAPHNARMADRIEAALVSAGVTFDKTGPMFGGRQTRRKLIDMDKQYGPRRPQPGSPG